MKRKSSERKEVKEAGEELTLHSKGSESLKVEKKRRRLEKKKRTERVRSGDRRRVKRVHSGKGYEKVRRGSERRRGKKWGDRVPTTKPCTKGANRQLRKKQRSKKGSKGGKGSKGSKGSKGKKGK